MSAGDERKPSPASPVEAFGKYRLTRRLAHGGMAEVFLATSHGEAGFSKPVVIKRLHPRLSEDAEFVNMLIDEARITSQLTHTNICQVLDLGSIDGSYFLAMEYIAGEELRMVQEHFMREGVPFPEPAALHVLSEVLAGLDYAHNQVSHDGEPLNIIHRDVSPQNVLVSYEGEVKVIDFGIAKARSRIVKTEAGVIKGKFRYMSPEQAAGAEIDHRTDIFAAGVVLYELLIGRPHLMDVPDTEALRRMREAELEPLEKHRPDLAPDLVAIVNKALTRTPRRRYQTAMEFRDAIDAYQRARGQIYGRAELAKLMRDRFATKRRAGTPGGVRDRPPRRPIEPTQALAGPADGSERAISGPTPAGAGSSEATSPGGPLYAVASGDIVSDSGKTGSEEVCSPALARAPTVPSVPHASAAGEPPALLTSAGTVAHARRAGGTAADEQGASGAWTIARAPGAAAAGADPRSAMRTLSRPREAPPAFEEGEGPLAEVSTGQATREFLAPPDAPVDTEGGHAMLGQRVAGQAAAAPPAARRREERPPRVAAPPPTAPSTERRPVEATAREVREPREPRGGRVGGTALRWSARETDPRPRPEPGVRWRPAPAAPLPAEEATEQRRDTRVDRRWKQGLASLIGKLITLAAMVGVLLAGAYAAKRLGLFDLFGSKPAAAPADGAPLILDAPAKGTADAALGHVQVNSKPPGARISACGVPTGQVTPATVPLPEGQQCVIELTLAGYAPYRSDSLTVNAGERLLIRAVLRRAAQTAVPGGGGPRRAPSGARTSRGPVAHPLPPATTGRLVVTSLQLAEVFVDGRLAGRTPRLVLDLAPGGHTVFVRFTELGTASPARQVTLHAGESRTEHFRAAEQ